LQAQEIFLQIHFREERNFGVSKIFCHLSEKVRIPHRISATGRVKVSGRKSSQYCASENTNCIVQFLV
jgi:hypothetical protein